jgi:putative addiction module component (TIGR02574 family)
MMEMTEEQVEIEALALPRHARARIASLLIASLDEASDVERAWDEEVRRRVAELRSGKAQTVPAEDVFKEIEDLLR